MTIEGTLIEKFDTQEVTDSFKKREFVVEHAENPQYPEFLKFELIQTNCQQLDEFEPGEALKVSFNLKGRKWTDPQGSVKYFNTLQAWRLEKSGPQDTPPAQDAPPAGEDWMKEDFANDEDLPF